MNLAIVYHLPQEGLYDMPSLHRIENFQIITKIEKNISNRPHDYKKRKETIKLKEVYS